MWHEDADIAAYKKAARETGMLYQSLHAPFSRAADFWKEDQAASAAAVTELKHCLAACASNEIPLMVAHAFIGFEDHQPTDAGVHRFGEVVVEAERLGVKIAFENTEGEEYLAALMSAFHGCRHVGFCWDTGHEQCYNRGRNLMSLYGEKILSTHLNDNLGIRDFHGERIFWTDDLHLLPFDGICDWHAIAAELAKYHFTDTLTFELCVRSKPNRFENDALHADKPVLVDFWAQWCPYCRRIAPAFDKVGEQYADTLITGKINYDEEPQLIQRFGIDTIPTLMLFKNGEVLGSVVAPASKAAIETFIQETLAQ